jgi:hypothetical protein
MAALPTSLWDKILQTPSTTINSWYTISSKFDKNWRKWKSIMTRLKGDTDTKKKGVKFPLRYTPPAHHDPNAMDTCEDFIEVQRMAMEERERHIRNGLCFRCHQSGYVTQECTSPGSSQSRQVNTLSSNTSASSSAPPVLTYILPTFNAATDVYGYMRAIYKGLSDKKQAKLVGEMENSGY